MSAADSKPDSPERSSLPEGLWQSPHHGFQGDRDPLPINVAVPASLTVAVSREAGSRGSTIAARAGLKLGWQVYNQELLEYIAQEGSYRQNVVDNLSSTASQWVEERLDHLLKGPYLSQFPSIVNIARLVLALGAQGEVVLIGRGAGYILPQASTLHVRIVAPLANRIAYMSQWLRLGKEEAAEQVRMRDGRRAEFIASHFHSQPGDCYQYDLLLNSSLLGEDLCAELIARAARAKLAAQFCPPP